MRDRGCASPAHSAFRTSPAIFHGSSLLPLPSGPCLPCFGCLHLLFSHKYMAFWQVIRSECRLADGAWGFLMFSVKEICRKLKSLQLCEIQGIAQRVGNICRALDEERGRTRGRKTPQASQTFVF